VNKTSEGRQRPATIASSLAHGSGAESPEPSCVCGYTTAAHEAAEITSARFKQVIRAARIRRALCSANIRAEMVEALDTALEAGYGMMSVWLR
jgi:hypothetical protein